MRLNQLNGLLAFLAVADKRGFSAAARSLGISAAALSQSVRGLEARLGTPLLVRTTRSVNVTEAGRRLLERGGPALREALAAVEQAAAGGAEVSGLLRLNVPRLAWPILSDPIARLLRQHRRLSVEIDLDDQRVDIVERGYDAGVRLTEYIERDLVAVRITPPFQFVIVGAPSYLRAHGAPRSPAELLGHRCLGFRSATTGAVYAWEFERAGREFQLPVQGPLVTNDSQVMIDAALRGMGLAYVSELAVAAPLRARRLRTVLQDFTPRVPGFFLYFPRRAQKLPKLRALLDALRAGPDR